MLWDSNSFTAVVFGICEAIRYPLYSMSFFPLCVYVCAKLLQSCSTLCDIMDCNPPDLSVHGLLQARTLEWVAMLSSRGSSRLRDRPGVSCIAGDSLPLSHQGSPTLLITSKLMMVLPVLTLRGAHCWW